MRFRACASEPFEQPAKGIFDSLLGWVAGQAPSGRSRFLQKKRFAFPVELARSYPIAMNEVQTAASPEPSYASPTPVMTPREIVSELDRYIVGQKDAKRAVAIALRNRWRRQLVPEDLREEIAPKNIIMIGPTGVGKTEISRRLAKLAQAPFIKVEASKFTEVG